MPLKLTIRNWPEICSCDAPTSMRRARVLQLGGQRGGCRADNGCGSAGECIANVLASAPPSWSWTVHPSMCAGHALIWHSSEQYVASLHRAHTNPPGPEHPSRWQPHSFLCAPRAFFWHSREQYVASLHREQASPPGPEHPSRWQPPASSEVDGCTGNLAGDAAGCRSDVDGSSIDSSSASARSYIPGPRGTMYSANAIAPIWATWSSSNCRPSHRTASSRKNTQDRLRNAKRGLVRAHRG